MQAREDSTSNGSNGADRSRGLDIAVLVKQVPSVENLQLLENGRLNREVADLEMNAYCRRAVSQGVELARSSGGRCVVYTLGPPQAEDILREAVAWGADLGVLVSDPALAGSDTLATARALAAALRLDGPWDVVLVGRNSIDADTGQVGPQLAELLDLPFASAVRQLTLERRSLLLHCETDSGFRILSATLPIVLSVAERLIDPCKMPMEKRAAVDAAKLRSISTKELGRGPWGEAASRTRVGRVREFMVDRRRIVLSGSVDHQVIRAVELLREWGTVPLRHQSGAERDEGAGAHAVDQGMVQGSVHGEEPEVIVAVVVNEEQSRVTRELLGEAAEIGAARGGHVVAVGPDLKDIATLGSWGADQVVSIVDTNVEEDVAEALARWCTDADPWCVLAPGTLWGREVASRLAARTDAGLTGDAISLHAEQDRLISWKPALGGRLVAAIAATSRGQLVTIRPGMLPLRSPRASSSVPDLRLFAGYRRNRIAIVDENRDEGPGNLESARIVVAIGQGVDPEGLPQINQLANIIGAEIGATRKVTDRGWLPRARQIGITGHSISPALYIGVGISGRFNHTVGIAGAGVIVMVNADPAASAFEISDIGMIGDWKEVLPALIGSLASSHGLESNVTIGG